MLVFEITDAIEIRRCKRALYFGREVALTHQGTIVSGRVLSIRPNPDGAGILASIMPMPAPAAAAGRAGAASRGTAG
jgi:hypothetical protein